MTSKYDYLGDIGGGAQAGILLCTERATGETVAVKFYVGDSEIVDPRVQRSLEDGNPRFVVPSRLESGDGEQWEVMEYFPLGSLHDILVRRNGEPLGARFARRFVERMAGSLEYLRGLDIVHRDLKPANVLVRSEQPLDVVIGDFGVSIKTRATAVASVRGTWAYAPPEASYTKVTFRGDWWSLGMMTFELLTGHHVLADPVTGLLPNDHRTRQLVGDGEFELMAVSDPRWHLLLSGLLTHKPADRWTGKQVRDWLAGDSPLVKRPVPADSTGPAYTARTARLKPFPVGDRTYTDPAELILAMAREWPIGVEKVRDEPDALRELLVGAGVDPNTVRNCLSRTSPELRLIALQCSLLPDRPPLFHGRELDGRRLTEAADLAQKGDVAAAEWIGDLRNRRVLGELSRFVENGDDLARADDRLARWWRDVDRWSSQLGSNPDISEQLAPLQARWAGQLLAAALDDTAAVELRRTCARVRAEPGDVPAWAEPLAQAAAEVESSGSAGLGIAAVAAAVLGPARDLERGRLAAEEQAQRDQVRSAQRELAQTRRAAAGGRFRGRLLAVPLYAAVAGLVSALPGESSLQGIVSSERLWPAAAVAAASVLALSAGVYAWEAYVKPVQLAARPSLLVAGIIGSVALWCAAALDWLSPYGFPATPVAWWVVPPVVCGVWFVIAVGLANLTGPTVTSPVQAREAERSWRAPQAPRAVQRLAGVLVLTVFLAGAVVIAQAIGVLALATGQAASPLAGVDVPDWALTTVARIDQYLPNLPLPSEAGARLVASTAIFLFGMIMARLYRDLSRIGTAWAVLGVLAAIVLDLLLVGTPGDLIQGATVIVYIAMVIGIVLVGIWILISMMAG